VIEGYAIIREAAHEAADAAKTAVEGLREGRIQGEEPFTDRMIGAIEQRMNGLQTKGIRWSALTLTAHQRGAQETTFGADFMGVLHINLPDFRVQKGFLAQAKLLEPNAYFSPNESRRLAEQCRRMLAHSPDSFVFLYSRYSIRVVPAISVVGLHQPMSPYALYRRSIARFFEEHFESFIGDSRMSGPNVESLKALQEQVGTRLVLFLKGGIDGVPQEND